jgi:hypothetical protein
LDFWQCCKASPAALCTGAGVCRRREPGNLPESPLEFRPLAGGEDELAKLLLDPEFRAVLPVELRAPPERPSIPGRIVRGILRIAPTAAALGALLFCVLAYS